MENQQDIYKTEACELLDDLEEALLELEKTPDDIELIGRIFRAMHTIKGSGAMFGFDQIAAFTHDIETTYDKIRNGELKVSPKLIDLTLAACDQIRQMLNDSDLCPKETTLILQGLREILPEQKEANGAETAGSILLEDHDFVAEKTWWIRFKPDAAMMTLGGNPVLLLNELREMGKSWVVAHTRLIPGIDEIIPDHCYTFWDVLLTTRQNEDGLRDVFIFVEDDCKLTIECIDEAQKVDDESGAVLAEILVKEGKSTPGRIKKKLRAVIEKLKPAVVQTALSESPEQETEDTAEGLSPGQAEPSAASKAASVSNIRVASEKLDNLVDLVGELVIVQERLNRYAVNHEEADLVLVAEETNRLISELRDIAMEMRLLPIGSTFGKFKRLVRDLAHEQGKNIILTTEGGETELDKTVLERLNDPLIHIIRNAIDHGIEPSSVRLFAGKPNQSRVHLSAAHSGSDVVIRISDDGKGLNTQTILSKAVEQGLIGADAELTEKEIHGLIFQPGFSTAEQVSNLSGRGVGMDVVKKNIEDLRGSVSVSSKANEGTTITLRLPITLGIIEGLLVRISESYFVLPLSAVEECIDIRREKQNGKYIANVRGEVVPYISLRQQFDVAGESPEIEHILITHIDETRIGFLVDEVIGEHQIVIKSLGKMYRHVEGLSGATILGDGTVALILDVQHLTEMAETDEAARYNQTKDSAD